MLLSPVDQNWNKRQQQRDPDSDGNNKLLTADNSACLVRHAGRALIRGRFRRVWRPRYLELWDNGLVRYYELPLTAVNAISNSTEINLDNESSMNSNNRNSPLRLPKATLRIFHARILDVTTFRDMQVGLPHGSYGFLFHGQREYEDSFARMAVSPRRRHSSNSNHNLYSNSHHSSGTLSCHPTELSMMTPRDYMCAVDTLEEAQSWVVALQWAALQESNWSSGASTPLERGWSFDSCDHAATTEPMKEHAVNVTATTQPNLSSTNASFESSSSRNEAASHQRLGKVVITKCRRYRWVRVVSGTGQVQEHHWDVAYEIDLLLLVKTRRPRNRRKKRPSPENSLEDATAAPATTEDDEEDNETNNNKARESWTVQEWSLLRTASDIQNLLDNLAAELGSAIPTSIQMPVAANNALNELQRQALTLPYRRTPKRHRFRMVTHGGIQKSTKVVDSILRSLALEAVVVNSRAMKAFWGLLPSEHHINGNNALDSKNRHLLLIWEFQNGSAAIAKQPARTIAPEYTTDGFVKEWLQEDGWTMRKSRHPTWWNYQAAWIMVAFLATPYLIPTLVCVLAILVLVPIWSVGRQYADATVTIRLDVLLLSHVIAIILGGWRSRKSGESKRNLLPIGNLSTNEAAAPMADVDDTSEVMVDDASSTSIESFDLAVAAGVVEESTIMPPLPNPYNVNDPNRFSDRRSSPLPKFDPSLAELCSSSWSKPEDEIFHVRGETYLHDRVKVPSSQSAFVCRGVDVWITDNPERHIARHPSVLGGRLGEEDTFLVNFLLPFANFVAYFTVPPLSEFPNEKLAKLWCNFVQGDQQYRDARLKLLPVVVEGPWIVKAAVGPGTSPALLGKVIPLQYFFREPDGQRKGVYEVDVIITASTIAKGILSVVKGHTKSLTIAFAFIVEAAQQEELPETVLCALQVHSLHLEDCPLLPTCNLDEIDS